MSSFPTLSKNPSYPLDPDGDLEDVILRTPSDAGYVQTRPRFTRSRRTWGINYAALPDADVSTLRTFEQVTLVNAADLFSWTHPISSTTYTVQLAGPIKYARVMGAENASNVSMTLQEV